MRLSRFCDDLFLLAVSGVSGTAARGRDWENLIGDHLARNCVQVETLPGGYRVFGLASMSGLRHQIDATVDVADALVIAEWKAYRGDLPKNELLRFKAASDDYFVALGRSVPRKPIIRIFGGPGDSSADLRRYAGYHGITLVDRWLWPLPVLLDSTGGRPDEAMGEGARRRLSWLMRPMQQVLRPTNVGYVIGQPPSRAGIDSLLALHDLWSAHRWLAFDRAPGSFEALLDRRAPQRMSAA